MDKVDEITVHRKRNAMALKHITKYSTSHKIREMKKFKFRGNSMGKIYLFNKKCQNNWIPMGGREGGETPQPFISYHTQKVTQNGSQA